MYARATSQGPRLAGAFMRNVRALAVSPTAGTLNTGSGAALQGKTLDPFRRSGAVLFGIDRIAMMTSPFAQTSAGVNVMGWADTPAGWNSAAIGNGDWIYRVRSSGVRIGAGPSLPTGRWSESVSFVQSGGAGIPRSLYLYTNRAFLGVIAGQGNNARSLYLYVNKGHRGHLDKPHPRSLYLYVNKGWIGTVARRALYLYSSARDGEVFPYLNHLQPTEQYAGGQVDLYGDGFGGYLDACVPTAPTITVSSTYGSSVKGNAIDGTTAEWQSTSGAAAWIRFTWTAPKRIVAVALEGSIASVSWGIPQFRFDDGSTENGSVTVPLGLASHRSSEYPIGGVRHLYTLSAPKTTTYVEIAVASGGYNANRGFTEVLIVEEAVTPDFAELSRVWLNLDLPAVQDMGIVAWQNRSPNWHPANGGVAPLPAATVTIPAGAVSGLVTVQEEL